MCYEFILDFLKKCFAAYLQNSKKSVPLQRFREGNAQKN